MKRKPTKENPLAGDVAHLKQLQAGEILTKQDIIAIAFVVNQFGQLKAVLRSIAKLHSDVIERYLIDN